MNNCINYTTGVLFVVIHVSVLIVFNCSAILMYWIHIESGLVQKTTKTSDPISETIHDN